MAWRQGMLLRTAVALGWQGVFCLPGCCDLFNDKALRAARGAAFRLPYAFGTWDDLHAVAAHHSMACMAAALPADGKSLCYCYRQRPSRVVFIFVLKTSHCCIGCCGCSELLMVSAIGTCCIPRSLQRAHIRAQLAFSSRYEQVGC